MIGKKGDFTLYFFVISTLIFLGLVIYILGLQVPDLTFVGSTQSKVLFSYDLAETAKLYLDISAVQATKLAEPEVFQRSLRDCQLVGGLPVMDDDCIADEKKLLEERFRIHFTRFAHLYPEVSMVDIDYSVNIEEDLEVIFTRMLRVPVYANQNSYFGLKVKRDEFRQNELGYLVRDGLQSSFMPDGLNSTKIYFTNSFDPEKTYQYFLTEGKSVNYLVDKQGQIYRLVPENRQSTLCQTCARSLIIGIINCEEKNVCQNELTQLQQESLVELLQDVSLRNRLEINPQTLTGFNQTNPPLEFDFNTLISEVNS